MTSKSPEVVAPPEGWLDLSPEKVDDHAFDLITLFNETLTDAEDFQGQFSFWRGSVLWQTNYTFTSDTHELLIKREDHFECTSIILKSRRFPDQKTILHPEVKRSYSPHDGGYRTASTPTVNENNFLALVEAKKILEDFKSTSPKSA